MSDEDAKDEDAKDDGEGEEKEEKKFFAELAKSGRATCKKCKQKLEHGALRLARAGYNPFGPGVLKQWHHVDCLFEVFAKQRASTARINTPDDLDGWSDLEEEHQAEILRHLPGVSADDYKTDKKDKPASSEKKTPKAKKRKSRPASPSVPGHKDNLFREYRRLCLLIGNENQYTRKTAVVKEFFEKGTDGDGFKSNLRVWIRLLLPGAIKRVYNLKSKQLIKLFSRILHQDQDEMLEDLEQGDIAQTITTFFQSSKHLPPVKSSKLTVQEVDNYLNELSQLTREEEQVNLFTKIAKRCTANDITFVIRLITADLRIGTGAKHILEGLHPDAYQAFQTSQDIDNVLDMVAGVNATDKSNDKPQSLNISVKLMTPVLPMLAEACKSIQQALKKCPNGMYAEVKYDGERVQVHKSGSEFKYFSRSLKPVMPHKVNHFKDFIPKAFPSGDDLILDSEILMIDTNTGMPLPFGTLGIHKKGEYKDACVCLFVFDCIYLNGKSLLHKPIRERREILHNNMNEIKNHVMFSEMQEVNTTKDLENMITKVFQAGLEGLVLKDLESIYEPGKRHWLKVKKDYLFGGAMADTADLVVLGAWFGTGQKGGMMSVFLMCCWDPAHHRWCTVTKVHTGHDDKTLERLQTELKMVKIGKDIRKVPPWLKCTKTMVPDFVAENPKEMPVWEITGAEFTQHDVHTADGISIRFPRVTRIRSDKCWETATNLPDLKVLFKKSKDNTDFSLAEFTSGCKGSGTKSPMRTVVSSPHKEDESIASNDQDFSDQCDDASMHDNDEMIAAESNLCKKKPNTKCSESSSRKRKGSDILESDIAPTKKVNLEGVSQVYTEDSTGLTNSEAFARLIVSEIQLITDPVLYCSVKGKLFSLIHEAQEKQLVLNESKIKSDACTQVCLEPNNSKCSVVSELSCKKDKIKSENTDCHITEDDGSNENGKRDGDCKKGQPNNLSNSTDSVQTNGDPSKGNSTPEENSASDSVEVLKAGIHASGSKSTSEQEES